DGRRVLPRVRGDDARARRRGRGMTVIAIDGPAGSGKSTLARRLAVELGLPYVNTGLMYRALARRALDLDIDSDDVERIVSRVSRHPGVRAWMRDVQRELGTGGAVMEGRDIGSVIFPDAAMK